MENSNCFKFELLSYHTYVKEGVEKVIINAVCNFGFIVKLYTTSRRFVELQDELKKNNTKDITKFVNIYADDRGFFSYNLKNR